MTQKNFKAYKNMPVRCRIEKPRYWYIDKVVFPKDGAIYDNILKPFEAIVINVKGDSSTIKIEDTPLYDGTTMPAGEYAFAPEGKDYFAQNKAVEYTKVGSPNIDGFIVNGLSKSNYLNFPSMDFTNADEWQIRINFKPTSLNTGQFLFSLASSGTMYGITFGIENGKGEILISKGANTWHAIWSFDLIADEWQTVVIKYNSSTGYSAEHYSNISDFKVVGTLGDTGKISLNPLIGTIGFLPNYGYADAWKGEVNLEDCYISIDSSRVWGVDSGYKILNKVPGCGNILPGSSSNQGVVLYKKKANDKLSIELSEIVKDGEYVNPEGKIWFGYANLRAYYSPVYFEVKFRDIGNPVYTAENNRLFVNLYKNNALSLINDYYYPIKKPNMTFFDYDIRFTTRARTKTNNETSTIIVPANEGFNQSILLNRGKFGVLNTLLSDEVLDTNEFYWLRVAETYNVSTGTFTHRIAYIKDNNYFSTDLPDETEWIVKTITDSTPWFDADKPLRKIGCDSGSGYAWNGEIDLTNTWIDLGVKSEHTWSYTTNWEAAPIHTNGRINIGPDYD